MLCSVIPFLRSCLPHSHAPFFCYQTPSDHQRVRLLKMLSKKQERLNRISVSKGKEKHTTIKKSWKEERVHGLADGEVEAWQGEMVEDGQYTCKSRTMPRDG